MLQAALSTYYVASLILKNKSMYWDKLCLVHASATGMHTDSGILLVSSEFLDTSWPASYAFKIPFAIM